MSPTESRIIGNTNNITGRSLGFFYNITNSNDPIRKMLKTRHPNDKDCCCDFKRCLRFERTEAVDPNLRDFSLIGSTAPAYPIQGFSKKTCCLADIPVVSTQDGFIIPQWSVNIGFLGTPYSADNERIFFSSNDTAEVAAFLKGQGVLTGYGDGVLGKEWTVRASAPTPWCERGAVGYLNNFNYAMGLGTIPVSITGDLNINCKGKRKEPVLYGYWPNADDISLIFNITNITTKKVKDYWVVDSFALEFKPNIGPDTPMWQVRGLSSQDDPANQEGNINVRNKVSFQPGGNAQIGFNASEGINIIPIGLGNNPSGNGFAYGTVYFSGNYNGDFDTWISEYTVDWPGLFYDIDRDFENGQSRSETFPLLALTNQFFANVYGGSIGRMNYSGAIFGFGGPGYDISPNDFFCGDFLWAIENGPCRSEIETILEGEPYRYPQQQNPTDLGSNTDYQFLSGSTKFSLTEFDSNVFYDYLCEENCSPSFGGDCPPSSIDIHIEENMVKPSIEAVGGFEAGNYKLDMVPGTCGGQYSTVINNELTLTLVRRLSAASIPCTTWDEVLYLNVDPFIQFIYPDITYGEPLPKKLYTLTADNHNMGIDGGEVTLTLVNPISGEITTRIIPIGPNGSQYTRKDSAYWEGIGREIITVDENPDGSDEK